MSSQRAPSTLYKLCAARVIGGRALDTDSIHELPDTVLLDVYYQMLLEKKLCVLGSELCELDVMTRLLRFADAPPPHHRLLACFQAVMEHGMDCAGSLAEAYVRRCAHLLPSPPAPTAADPPPAPCVNKSCAPRHSASSGNGTQHAPLHHVTLGLKLGGFLNSAGWYAAAERVLCVCRDVCSASALPVALRLRCLQRLLNTQAAYCSFPGAADTLQRALHPLGLQASGTGVDVHRVDDSLSATWPGLLPRLYKEFSSLHFVRCDYGAAFAWSARALRLLRDTTDPKVCVEVLRACGKACVVKRKFACAGLLMRQAVATARNAFGPHHPRYAFALLDYGFYLLNIDSILHSVSVYEEALGVLRGAFGQRSLHVATAQEDLAYALYVLEYSSGRFYKAKEHVEKAIAIIETLVPADHLLLASAKRVKALILEEIALDAGAGGAGDAGGEQELLEESEELHKAALRLSMMAFGNKNVQTAKHYGNLGRLYQSMHRFDLAEKMHLKAIAIKEELLGPEDYEVGLSIGHLASLYNYHMRNYRAAELLYTRSIAISLKLFGERYSGLEYDYRGLVHVHTQTKQHALAAAAARRLQRWHELRELSRTEPQPSEHTERAMSLQELKDTFLKLN